LGHLQPIPLLASQLLSSSLLQNSSEKVVYQPKWLESRIPVFSGVKIGLRTKPERIGK